MDKERIEQILNKIGSADVPSEIKQMADETAGEFSRKLSKMPKRILIWEIIMKGRLIKIATAACITLAVVLGIWFFTSATTPVALADVLQKVEQAQAFMYTMKMNMTGNMQPGMPTGETEVTGTALISNEYGMKIDMDTNTITGSNTQKMRQQMYVLPQEKVIYMVMPEQKQYIKMEFSDDLLARIKKQSNDPRDMLKQILKSKCTNIGKSEIDGVAVEGFETTDPASVGGMVEDVKLTLWVDEKTYLPFRMEINMKINEQMKMEAVIDDFQWEMQVNADEFKPVIPQDYTTPLPDGYKLPSLNEEGAIDGLKFCSQLSGRYPEKIDYLNLMNEMKNAFASIDDINNPEAQLKLRESLGERLGLAEKKGKLTQEEITKMTLEMMRPIQSLGMFYMTLIQENKEPVYYGNIVTPADTDKVLLRWKTGDNEYRVVYGDLRVETVDGSVLAELENKLPK